MGKQYELADILNNATTQDYFNRLKILAMSMFEWINLPETCDSRFLEQTLFNEGKAVFIKDEALGFLNLKVTPAGQLNVYELPTQVQAFSVNYSHIYDSDEVVVIMNNILQLPTASTLQLYAHRLSEIQRTSDINITAQKTPILIRCTKSQLITLKNIYLKYDGNVPVIFADKEQDMGKILEALKTDAPFVADKLRIEKDSLMNEVMTYLGLNNANTQKRERMISEEVNANDEIINLNMDSFLSVRKLACKQINEMFNLNIDVKLRDDIKENLIKLKDDERLINIENQDNDNLVVIDTKPEPNTEVAVNE